jgi:hypothetical protein
LPEGIILVLKLGNPLIEELDLVILNNLSFFYEELGLWMGSFFEDEAFFAFGIEGNLDVTVFKDGIWWWLFGQLMPEHHLILDLLGQEVYLPLQLEGVIGLKSVPQDYIDVRSHDLWENNNKNVIKEE